MHTIEQRVLTIITQSLKLKTNATVDMLLKQDLRLDSLSFTELIVACEDEFGVEIDMDHPDTQQAETVRDLCNGISRLIGPN